VRVIAKKFDNDIVRVELVEVPKHIKFARLREEKKLAELEKKTKVEEKKEEKPEEIQPKPEEKEKEKRSSEQSSESAAEAKEKEAASKEEGLTKAKMQAKEMRHISKDKKVQIHRKALSR